MPKSGSLSTAALPSSLDLWFARYSTGFGGKPVAGKKGFENHRLRRRGDTLVVESTSAFDNWGLHRYSLRDEVTLGDEPSAKRTTFEAPETGVLVTGAWRAKGRERSWTVKIDQNGDRSSTVFSSARPLIPSVVGRFLPLMLPRAKGSTFSYMPFPEDARRSMFPLVVNPVVTSLVCVRNEKLKLGRTTVPAWRFEHRGRKAWAVAWVSEDGEFLKHEQPGCVLVAMSKKEALSKLPKEVAPFAP